MGGSDVLAEILNDSMSVLSFFDGESYHIYFRMEFQFLFKSPTNLLYNS
jgi:hypothetical protein